MAFRSHPALLAYIKGWTTVVVREEPRGKKNSRMARPGPDRGGTVRKTKEVGLGGCCHVDGRSVIAYVDMKYIELLAVCRLRVVQ
jgi:hypothetical protein